MNAWFRKVDATLTERRLAVSVGLVVLILASAGLMYLAFSGALRKAPTMHTIFGAASTSTVNLVPRRLDGVLVPEGEDALPTYAVMIENHPDARPLSGISQASAVIEAPVEGGITRFVALFDATSTVQEIGPVRSARPYFVEWAHGWKSVYAHVGGSPDAIQLLNGLAGIVNLDEMHKSSAFWRSDERRAPHNAYTRIDLLNAAVNTMGATTSSAAVAWRFDQSTSTKMGDQKTIRIPYGGSYNVVWKFNKDTGLYTRYQAGAAQGDKDGAPVQADNVVVMKTDASVLDAVGRLKIRTTGGGEAIVYHHGNKYVGRWSRGMNDPIRFSGLSGTDLLLKPGKTWVEVTTDDVTFAGLEK